MLVPEMLPQDAPALDEPKAFPLIPLPEDLTARFNPSKYLQNASPMDRAPMEVCCGDRIRR